MRLGRAGRCWASSIEAVRIAVTTGVTARDDGIKEGWRDSDGDDNVIRPYVTTIAVAVSVATVMAQAVTVSRGVMIGHVHTNAGDTLAEAVVLIHADRIERTARVPDDVFPSTAGRFTREVEPGTYDVCTFQPGFEPSCSKLRVKAGQRTEWSFLLPISRATIADDQKPFGEGILRGSVVDASGRPVSSALVFVHEDPAIKFQIPVMPDRTLITDGTGTFSVRLSGTFYDVCALAPSRSPQCEKVRIRDGQTLQPRLTLRIDSSASATPRTP